VARRTAWPGSGGTKTSGSKRVAAIFAASEFGGQDAVLDEEDVAVEAGALVAGAHLRDHTEDADGLAVGQGPLEGHDVVELEHGAGRERDPEFERSGIVGADDAADERATVGVV
jgi:hypothetical protein